MEVGNKRLTLLVGCNYPNTTYELHGCINDVIAVRKTLMNRFGFDPKNIELITDAEEHDTGDSSSASLVKPTGANIKKALEAMIDKAEDGDVLFFHFSGHGTWIPSVTSKPFRHDEAIVPCDFNLITDVDFRDLGNRLPKKASFTFFSDSCHSGGLIDKEKEQIGPSTPNTTTTLTNPNLSNHSQIRPKIIPFDSIIEHLTTLTNIKTYIATHFLESFGSNASLKFRLPKIKLDFLESLKKDGGILLSGCQANETSVDMNPNMGGGKSYGAFSNSVQIVLNQNSNPLSNRKIVMLSRKLLKKQGGFEQHACLYCNDGNIDAPFLWQPITSSSLSKVGSSYGV